MNKFCILAAGRGTRNNNVSGLHKALLPLENKPVISHIIDRIGDVEIVIAVGYKSNQYFFDFALSNSFEKEEYFMFNGSSATELSKTAQNLIFTFGYKF